jgi:anion-transporting  ArsA/GET3 family ATPase
MTAVHLVTLLEEMPVQETADSIEELSRLGMPIGTVIINATRPPLLAGARVTQAEVRRGLVAAGLAADKDTVAGLVAEAKAHQTRVGVEASLRAELTALGRPVIELPALPGGVSREGLEELADILVGV